MMVRHGRVQGAGTGGPDLPIVHRHRLSYVDRYAAIRRYDGSVNDGSDLLLFTMGSYILEWNRAGGLITGIST